MSYYCCSFEKDQVTKHKKISTKKIESVYEIVLNIKLNRENNGFLQIGRLDVEKTEIF